MARHAQSGRASRCILRDRRSVVSSAPHGCRNGCTRQHAQFLLRQKRRKRDRQHRPPELLDEGKILAAVRRSRALRDGRRIDKLPDSDSDDNPEDGSESAGVRNKKDCVEDDCDAGKADSEDVEHESDDSKSDDTVGDSESDLSDQDEATSRRLARLQNYACPRMRRKALLEWVNHRVQEVSREDADEPDAEEENIRTALMDAIGLASVNVEADLRDVNLADEFSRQVSRESFSRQVSRDSLETTCTLKSDASVGSRIRFAETSVTYLLKPETDPAVVARVPGRSWVIDQIVESDVYDGPSAPLRKWLG